MSEILDIPYLTKELDKVKVAAFMSENPVFLGSVLCSQQFSWRTDIETAATTGKELWWNPNWFLSLPKETRKTVLLHELWHVARMHISRLGKRDPTLWNRACDIRINNDLEDMGYTFEGTNPEKDQFFRGWVEEDIYDYLLIHNPTPPPLYIPDIKHDPNIQPSDLLDVVIQASHQSKLCGGAGDMPGSVTEILTKFLAPSVPWEHVLHKWFSELGETRYSWSRPNRRYQDIYLPSLIEDEGRLAHLIYYLDCSGSIDRDQVRRFSAEVFHVKSVYKPLKMTIVLFDTRIKREFVIEEEDSFDGIAVIGNGGTSLVCVHDHIQKHKPTAAIIFSDLEVAPMERLNPDIPILWVAVDNHSAVVPFGDIVHIRSK